MLLLLLYQHCLALPSTLSGIQSLPRDYRWGRQRFPFDLLQNAVVRDLFQVRQSLTVGTGYVMPSFDLHEEVDDVKRVLDVRPHRRQ